MRPSAKRKSSNAYVISVQLDKTTHEKLQAICKQSGFSRSRMIKTLILSAKVNVSSHLSQDE